MKPWPKSSQLPTNPMRGIGARTGIQIIPDRPWWYSDGGGRFYRQDWNTTKEMVPEITSIAEMEDFDKQNPISHPGFRPGQVWFLQFQQTDVVGVLNSVLPERQLLDKFRYPAYMYNAYANLMNSPESEIVWSFGGVRLTRSVFRDLFETGDAYLVADPVCPWLAPWAPK